jgi:predicted Zn-dependent protease with MMP-like domain
MMKEDEFEKLVIESIGELPEYFRKKMENITIHIEDFPDYNILKQLGHHSPYSILGLYQGIPVTRRGVHYRNVMPDRILIFRKPILRKSRYRPEIKNEIKRVVLHEVGHYFGLSEQELYLIEKNSLTPQGKIKNNSEKSAQ